MREPVAPSIVSVHHSSASNGSIGLRQANLRALRPRGMHHSNSAPTLDVTSILRAACLATHRLSYDALAEMGEMDNDDDDDDASNSTEVVDMLESAMDALDTSGSESGAVAMLADDSSDSSGFEFRTDDCHEDEEVVLTVSLPFGSGCGARREQGGGEGAHLSSPRRLKKRNARKSPSRRCSQPQQQQSSGKCRGSQIHSVHRQPTEIFLIPPMDLAYESEPCRLTVVLDLDETLVWARNATVVVRPFVQEFIQACLRNQCEIVLWTAGIPVYVNRILSAITRVVKRHTWFHYVIARSPLWYSDEGPTVKDLRLVQRPLERVLVLENSPASMQHQPQNVLLVEDFYGDNMEDQSLLFAGQVVERLTQDAKTKPHNVPVALQSDPILVPLSFLLAADHSTTGKPLSVASRGLRYTPRPANEHRVYSGVGPTFIGE